MKTGRLLQPLTAKPNGRCPWCSQPSPAQGYVDAHKRVWHQECADKCQGKS